MAVAAFAAKALPVSPAALALPDVVARDSIIAWYRGEFAAANAIIDVLCSHIVQITGGPSEYETVFSAIHRRRMNWIPVLHMQRYYSISDVTNELRRVASILKPLTPDAFAEAQAGGTDAHVVKADESDGADGTAMEEMRSSVSEERISGMVSEKQLSGIIVSEEQLSGIIVSEEQLSGIIVSEEQRSGIIVSEEQISGIVSEGTQGQYSTSDSSDCNTTGEGKSTNDHFRDKEGAEEDPTLAENVQICMDHEECLSRRPGKIKICKGFVAKEPVKGNMVNVVKGLKLYEDMFTSLELLKLTEYINGLRLAGHQGELSGETFIFFNKQVKGNKREIIQLGVPLFQPTNGEAASSIEPIPGVLLSLVDHLTQWRLLPQSKRPNSCIINFFDEDEHSQPYFKPPHIENPISTLFLSQTTIAFGRVLSSDQNGDYRGSLTLSLPEGSLLVMRGNSADMARHVICPSPTKRVSITFLKVRPPSAQADQSSPTSHQSKAITLWQPPAPATVPDPVPIPYVPVPAWGISLRAPVFMLAPARPAMVSPSQNQSHIHIQGRRVGRGGTGVFLPWTLGPKRYAKHLPPRIQKRRLPSLPAPVEAQVEQLLSAPSK